MIACLLVVFVLERRNVPAKRGGFAASARYSHGNETGHFAGSAKGAKKTRSPKGNFQDKKPQLLAESTGFLNERKKTPDKI